MDSLQYKNPHLNDLKCGATEHFIADKLMLLANELRGLVVSASAGANEVRASGARPISTLVAIAERELRHRRLRSKFLPRELFADGAWDMLLDLFVSKHAGRMISTTSACLAADMPATTALRWLDVLEQHGLVKRVPDTADRRVKNVALTERGHQAICSTLAGYQ